MVNSPPSNLRILRRKPMSGARPRPIRLQRLSLLDPRLNGDPWLVTHDDGELALYFGDHQVAALQGSDLDTPALNQLLFTLRHRRPRRGA